MKFLLLDIMLLLIIAVVFTHSAPDQDPTPASVEDSPSLLEGILLESQALINGSFIASRG